MLLSLATACLVASSTVSGGAPHSLATHPWGRWQTGAWIETESGVVGSSDQPMIERYELDRLGTEGYQLGTALVMEGGPDVETTVDRAWAFGGFAQHVPGARIVAREDVKVSGRNYACDVWESRTEYKGVLMVDRSWINPSFDLPLKTELSSADTQVSLTATRLSESVTIAKRSLRCVRYEGEARAQDKRVRMSQWVSLDVPGGVARLEAQMSVGDSLETFRREVTAFRGEKRPARELR